MKNMNFKLPSGVMVPDGTQSGDTFQAMGTFKLGSGGDAMLMEVDGEPLDGMKMDDETANPEAGDDTTEQATQNQTLQQRLMGGGTGM